SNVGLAPFIEDELQLQLYPGQRELAEEYDHEHPELASLRLGRRSGKTTLAAAIALHDCTANSYPGCTRPGEIRYCLLVSVGERQATMAAMSCVKTLINNSRSLRQLVAAETEQEVQFRNHTAIRVLPCSARSTRGLPASLVILDEHAHFVDSEGVASGSAVF